MSKPVKQTKTLEASGGEDTLSETAELNTDSGAVQVEVSGATSDASVYVDARLDDEFGWSSGHLYAAENVAATYTDLDQLDLSDVQEVRVRIVNNDIASGGDASAVLRTE
jgi:hypothetical protein